jgi:hypothetical protein
MKGLSDVITDTQRPTAVSGTKNGSGDNSLIAAPGAGWRIVVVAFVIQNESAVATTLILKDGATARFRVLGQNQGDGLALNLSLYPLRLSDNAALVLNLSDANSCGYSVHYFLERVNL